MNRLLISVFLACTFFGLKAQKVDNVRAAASGEQIIITYDLSGTQADQRFRVSLYSSHNNFVSPVQQVTGDVGENVSAGKDKRIAWSAKNELTNFKGDLSFEVRADLIGPAAPVTTPTSEFKFRDIPSVKRGSDLAIGWSGGTSGENVKLELMKDGGSQQTIANTQNKGSYTWNVPEDTKPGTYQIKVTGSSGNGLSSPFAIKHKIPTALKILPAVVVIGVVAAVAGGGGGGDDDDKKPPTDNLPEPKSPVN